MKNKAVLRFTEEWLIEMLKKETDLPEDFEIINLDRDAQAGAWSLIVTSSSFGPACEGAPYPRFYVRGKHTLCSSNA